MSADKIQNTKRTTYLPCSTPEYAVLKLPYQILQAGVGAVVAMILCRKFKLAELFEKKGLNKW